jgi:hypothetical protein
MQEALYHTAKYRYLYQQDISDTSKLHSVFENFVHENQFVKPHYALGIYTPAEVQAGADLSISHTNTFMQAAIERRAFNKNASCQQECP